MNTPRVRHENLLGETDVSAVPLSLRVWTTCRVWFSQHPECLPQLFRQSRHFRFSSSSFSNSRLFKTAPAFSQLLKVWHSRLIVIAHNMVSMETETVFFSCFRTINHTACLRAQKALSVECNRFIWLFIMAIPNVSFKIFPKKVAWSSLVIQMVKKWKWKVARLCLTLCDPTDYTVHGIHKARILEWVAFPFSTGSSRPRDGAQVSCITGKFFTSWATR